MEIYINPARDNWEKLTSRRRSDDSSVDATVSSIIGKVKDNGDKALISLSEEIDKVRPDSIEVSREEKEEAVRLVPANMKSALETAAARWCSAIHAIAPCTIGYSMPSNSVILVFICECFPSYSLSTNAP